MGKKLAGFLSALAIVALAMTGAVVFMPAPAAADIFSAGDLADGICSCPVSYGDCVCRWKT